jgi:hypothetical protein
MTKAKAPVPEIKKIRLNNWHRETIIKSATQKLEEKMAAHEKLGEELYFKALKATFSKKLLDAAQTVLESDLKMLSTSTSHTFNVGGRSISLPTSNPQPHFGYYGNYPAIANQILIEQIWSWAEKKEEIRIEMKTARATLSALLKTVATTESLFKVWPEGKNFYSVPPLTPPDKPQLPVVQVEALNTILGIGG